MGSRPTENISRNIVEAIRVRIPDGRGSVMTMASDTNIAVHTRPDNLGSSSTEIEHDTDTSSMVKSMK